MRKKIVALVLIIMLMATNSVWASVSLPENTETETDIESTIEPRSLYLAGAISEIANEGEGVLRIYADFSSYRSVPWTSLTITLQRKKDSSSESWSNVKTYTYEFKEEDQPSGELTYAGTEFYVRGMTTNYYYRVKCVHKVKTPSGSYESKTTLTDGVLLTSYPEFRIGEEKE